MEHRDCIIVYKNGKGISLRATRLTVENAYKMITVYNGDDLMAVVPLDEVKTVIFADCGDVENIKAMIEAITAGQKTYAKGKPFEDMTPFAFHPDNVPEMICQNRHFDPTQAEEA